MLFRVCQHVSTGHRNMSRVGYLSLGLALFLSGPHLVWAWQQEVKSDPAPPHCRNSGSTRDSTNGNTSDTDQHPSIC